MDFELFVYLMLHTYVPKNIFFSIHTKSIFSLKLKVRSVFMETLLNMPKSINGLWTICVPNVAYPCARIHFFSIHTKSLFSLKLKVRSVLMETLLNMPKSINGLWTICVHNVAYLCAQKHFFFQFTKNPFFP